MKRWELKTIYSFFSYFFAANETFAVWKGCCGRFNQPGRAIKLIFHRLSSLLNRRQHDWKEPESAMVAAVVLI
jgi:hypothetical protein